MNKKVLMGSILAGTMVLASCGTPAELGTFEQEIQKEQASYATSISDYIASMDNYQTGKFAQTGDYSVDIQVPKTVAATIAGTFSGDSILEKDAFGLDMEMDINAKVALDKEAEDVPTMALGAKGNVQAKLLLGMTNDTFYTNLEKLMFDVTGTEDLNAIVAQGKSQFDLVKGMFVGRWFSLELPEDFKQELKKSFTMNTKVIAMLKEVSTLLVSGDIFTAAEKTTYEGQDAYKFALDEEKAAKHLVTVLKTVSEKYSDVFTMYNVSQEDFETMIADLEEQVNNPETFAEATFETEFYLTRAKDGGANIYMTKFAPVGQSETQNLSLSIEANVLTIAFKDNEANVNLTLTWEKGGKLVFSGDVKEWETQLGAFDGMYTGSEKSGSYISKMDFNVNVLAQKDGYDPITKNGITLKLTMNGTTKKDDSIAITKESITDNAEEVMDLAPMISGFVGSMMMGGGLDMNMINENMQADDSQDLADDMSESNSEMKEAIDESQAELDASLEEVQEQLDNLEKELPSAQ